MPSGMKLGIAGAPFSGLLGFSFNKACQTARFAVRAEWLLACLRVRSSSWRDRFSSFAPQPKARLHPHCGLRRQVNMHREQKSRKLPSSQELESLSF